MLNPHRRPELGYCSTDLVDYRKLLLCSRKAIELRARSVSIGYFTWMVPRYEFPRNHHATKIPTARPNDSVLPPIHWAAPPIALLSH